MGCGASFETCKDVRSVHLNNSHPVPPQTHQIPQNPCPAVLPTDLGRCTSLCWGFPVPSKPPGVRSVTRPSHLITTYKLGHSNRNGGFLCIFTLKILWWFGKVILFGKYHMPSLKYGFKQQRLWVLLTLLLLPITCTVPSVVCAFNTQIKARHIQNHLHVGDNKNKSSCA